MYCKLLFVAWGELIKSRWALVGIHVAKGHANGSISSFICFYFGHHIVKVQSAEKERERELIVYNSPPTLTGARHQ